MLLHTAASLSNDSRGIKGNLTNVSIKEMFDVLICFDCGL